MSDKAIQFNGLTHAENDHLKLTVERLMAFGMRFESRFDNSLLILSNDLWSVHFTDEFREGVDLEIEFEYYESHAIERFPFWQLAKRLDIKGGATRVVQLDAIAGSAGTIQQFFADRKNERGPFDLKNDELNESLKKAIEALEANGFVLCTSNARHVTFKGKALDLTFFLGDFGQELLNFFATDHTSGKSLSMLAFLRSKGYRLLGEGPTTDIFVNYREANKKVLDAIPELLSEFLGESPRDSWTLSDRY